MPTDRELTEAAATLRQLAATELPEDGPADARLKDRLELAADTLDAVSTPEEPEEPA